VSYLSSSSKFIVQIKGTLYRAGSTYKRELDIDDNFRNGWGSTEALLIEKFSTILLTDEDPKCRKLGEDYFLRKSAHEGERSQEWEDLVWDRLSDHLDNHKVCFENGEMTREYSAILDIDKDKPFEFKVLESFLIFHTEVLPFSHCTTGYYSGIEDDDIDIEVGKFEDGRFVRRFILVEDIMAYIKENLEDLEEDDKRNDGIDFCCYIKGNAEYSGSYYDGDCEVNYEYYGLVDITKTVGVSENQIKQAKIEAEERMYKLMEEDL
jgi:hypothetical protein